MMNFSVIELGSEQSSVSLSFSMKSDSYVCVCVCARVRAPLPATSLPNTVDSGLGKRAGSSRRSKL